PPARPLVVFHNTNNDRDTPRVFGAVLFSFLVNGVLVVGLMLGGAFWASAGLNEDPGSDDRIVITEDIPDEAVIPLDIAQVGLEPGKDKSLDLPRIEPETFAGPVDPSLEAGQMGDPKQIETRLPTPGGDARIEGPGNPTLPGGDLFVP